MRRTFYSTNPNDYKIGDVVRDRVSGRVGVIRTIKKDSNGVPALQVYVKTLGATVDWSPGSVSILYRDGAPFKGFLGKEPTPIEPRASVKEEIGRGYIPTNAELGNKEKFLASYESSKKIIKRSLEENSLTSEGGRLSGVDVDTLSDLIVNNLPATILDAIERDHTVHISLNARSAAEGETGGPIVGLVDVLEKAKDRNQRGVVGARRIIDRLKSVYASDLSSMARRDALKGLSGDVVPASDINKIFEALNAPITKGSFGHLPAKAVHVNSIIEEVIRASQNNKILSTNPQARITDILQKLGHGFELEEPFLNESNPDILSKLHHDAYPPELREAYPWISRNDPLYASGYQEIAAEREDILDRTRNDLSMEFSYYDSARRANIDRLKNIMAKAKGPMDLLELSEAMFHSKDRDSQWRVQSLIHDLWGRPEEVSWNPDTSVNVIQRMRESASSSLGMGVRRGDKVALMVEGYNPLSQKFEKVSPIVRDIVTHTEDGDLPARLYLKWAPRELMKKFLAPPAQPNIVLKDTLDSSMEAETFNRDFIRVGGSKRPVEKILIDIGVLGKSGNDLPDRAVLQSKIGRAFTESSSYIIGKSPALDEEVSANIKMEVIQTLRSSRFKFDDIASVDDAFIKGIVAATKARYGGLRGMRDAILGKPSKEMSNSVSTSGEDDEGNSTESLEELLSRAETPEDVIMRKIDTESESRLAAEFKKEVLKSGNVEWGGYILKLDDDNRIYTEVNNSNIVQRIDFLGKENLETSSINGETGVVITTPTTSYLLPDERTEIEGLSWNSGSKDARSYFEDPGKAPEANVHGSVIAQSPNGPRRIIDMTSGISYAMDEYGTATMEGKSILKQVDFDTPLILDNMTKMSDLPIWKTKSDVMIGLSMKGGPEGQIQRAREASEARNFLSLDIETYGPSYDRLGSIGVVESKEGKVSTLLERSWAGWKAMKKLPISPTDLTEMDPNDAEISMLSEASKLLDSHKDAHIAIYNENVDLGKLASMASSHAERLRKENIIDEAENMDKASAIFREANDTRAMNVLFLEQAANPEGGFQSLGSVAARRGVATEESQLHGAAYDAAVTANVFNAGVQDYSSINPGEWSHLTAADVTHEIMYGRPTRSQDAFGNPINLPISNRMIGINDIYSSVNSNTGGEGYRLAIDDFSGGASRVIKANDALDLSVILQNLKPSGLTRAQAETESDRIALDLFQRQLHRLYTGEHHGASPFVHEVIGWRMRYANMAPQALTANVSSLEKMIEGGENVEQASERLNWIKNSLINDPRLKRQYMEGKPWYTKQYLTYDKSFYDKIDQEIRSGNMSRYEAELMISKRSRELYGIGGEALSERGFPTAPKSLAKPFHEWTITPNITNSYRIRVGDVGQTRYDIEEFALQTFRRKFGGNTDRGITTLTSLGLSRREAVAFMESGRFSGNKSSKREMVASHLISTGFTFENKTIPSLLAEAAQMPAGSKLEGRVSDMARAIREHVRDNSEEQLRTNPSLNQEFVGTPLWETLEERGHTDTSQNLKKISDYESSLWGGFASNREGLMRHEERVLQESNPARAVNQLRFSGHSIPDMFKNGRWGPSVIGKTPQSFLSANEEQGHGILASMLMKNAEREYRDSHMGSSTAFLNIHQKEEIERLLRWRHLDEALKGVSRGVLKPVTVKGEAVDIGKAIVPTAGGHHNFEDFVRSGNAEEVLQKARANPRLSAYLQRATEIYFGDNPNPAVPSTAGIVGPGAGASPAREAVAAVNAEIRLAESKGPSSARTALLSANTWSGVSGKARDLVGVLSGRTELSGDAMSETIRSVLNGKRSRVVAGVAMAAMLLSAAVSPVNTNDSSEYDGIPSNDKEVQSERTANIQHQRVKVRVRGKIGGTLNPMHVINAIHTAIDMHTISPSSRSQTVTEDKRGRESENRKIINKILG